MDGFEQLIKQLISNPKETECIEFKHNKCEPHMIGRDISALSNSATFYNQNNSYMIWGIKDDTHKIIGIIDNPPKSRNENLASLMRRLGVCEELGSGWDKIASSCEVYQLPAPKIDLYQENTKVTLFSHIPYSSMSPADKIRACYWHACLKHVCGEQMNNSSLRDRFGLKDSNSASISRLIKDAVEIKLIKPLNPETAPKHMKYIPFWA